MRQRKVFISFLGTGRYIPCKYVTNGGRESDVVEYVQEAILNLYCKDFKENDLALVFLTRQAEEIHWLKLKEEIGEQKYNVIPIRNIPEGHSEEDIWKVFELVYEQLQPHDEIILDVTHGFRSLPMLQIVLTNYAKSLKNVDVSKIFYGAFEALGPGYKVEENIPNPEDRKAPLLDLTAFSAVQSWTYGAQSFIETGQPKLITKLSYENIKPILAQTKGGDETANHIRRLMESLTKIETAINTNRGKVISEGDWVAKAQESLSYLQQDKSVFPLIKPILKQIEGKLSYFNEKEHWKAAVEWCINHGLVQQGITQLQEGIITYVASLVGLDPSDLEDREIVSQSLNILSHGIKQEKWKKPSSNHPDKVKKIIKNTSVIKLNNNYQRLSEYRNDINHGGYIDKALKNGSVFTTKLSEVYSEFLSISNS